MARTKARRPPATAPISFRAAQDRATVALKGARKRLDGLLPAASRKEIARIEARLTRLQKEVTKTRRRAEKRAEGIARRVWADVERRAMAVVRPIVRRLDLASRGEVDRLRRRIGDLERRLAEAAQASTAA